jgi:ketosteroid isomerase-like protein
MSGLDASTYTRGQLLQFTKGSPEAAAKHDKSGWLSLFSERGVVEDPVGSEPHHLTARRGGKSELERFYDTFIAPNDIVFHVHQDIVTPSTVLRDVDIQVTSSTGTVTTVPTYITYELTEEESQIRILRLAAYWELRSMVRHVMGQGWPGVKMTTVLAIRMARIQRMKGVWGYMKGFSGVHKRGKDRVQEFVGAVQAGDGGTLASLFAAENGGIEFPVGGRTFDTASFVSSVDARISASDLISSGPATAFRFAVQSAQSSWHGVAIFEFSKRGVKISRARFFWDT